MNSEYHFDWSQPVWVDDDFKIVPECNSTCKVQKLPEDAMNRANIAANLTAYLAKQSKASSYVINLDASWGYGKTYFVKRWITSIEAEGTHKAIYFNAWEVDDSDSPLVLLLDSLIAKINHKGFTEAVKNNACAVVRAGGKQASRILSKVTGLDAAEAYSDITGTNYNSLEKDTAALFGDLGDALFKNLDAKRRAKTALIEKLSSIYERKQNTIKHFRKPPIFIFIDELDRCKPTFAIELLEVVKHIFHISNFVFVVSTDTGALGYSIQAVYGNGFDSEQYLKRFFNRTITLPQPSVEQFLSGSESFKNLLELYDEFKFSNIERIRKTMLLSEDGRWMNSVFRNKSNEIWVDYFYLLNRDQNVELAANTFQFFNLSLRSIEQIIARAQTLDKDTIFYLPWILVLDSIRTKNIKFYQQLTARAVEARKVLAESFGTNVNNSMILSKNSKLPHIDNPHSRNLEDRWECARSSMDIIDFIELINGYRATADMELTDKVNDIYRRSGSIFTNSFKFSMRLNGLDKIFEIIETAAMIE